MKITYDIISGKISKDYSWVFQKGKEQYLPLPELENILDKHLNIYTGVWWDIVQDGINPYTQKKETYDTNRILNIITEIKQLLQKYPNNEVVLQYLSDAHVLIKDYQKAMQFFPISQNKMRRSGSSCQKITLKLLANIKCDSEDYFALFSNKLVKYQNLEHKLAIKTFENLLKDWELEHKETLNEYIIRIYPHLEKRPYDVFSQSAYFAEVKG
jgi:hypothetical protein